MFDYFVYYSFAFFFPEETSLFTKWARFYKSSYASASSFFFFFATPKILFNCLNGFPDIYINFNLLIS
jgi:hypothetical protein